MDRMLVASHGGNEHRLGLLPFGLSQFQFGDGFFVSKPGIVLDQLGNRFARLDRLIFDDQQLFNHTGCECSGSDRGRPRFDPTGRLK